MPRREARFQVNAPPAEVWRFIRDLESLCSCVPGVERVQVLDARSVELTVKEKLGIVPLVVKLAARIEAEAPPHRIHATASAEHLSMQIDVALQPSGPGTELTGLIQVTGAGPLKAVVDSLFEKRATERTQQFAKTLEERFGISAEAAPPVGEARAPGSLTRLRLWLGRLWRRLAGAPARPGP